MTRDQLLSERIGFAAAQAGVVGDELERLPAGIPANYSTEGGLRTIESNLAMCLQELDMLKRYAPKADSLGATGA